MLEYFWKYYWSFSGRGNIFGAYVKIQPAAGAGTTGDNRIRAITDK
jgi:hypothetical protein